MNETMAKFGYPETEVAGYEHWVVLARPRQVTLGSLVLVCREPATAYGAISEAAVSEQGQVVSDIEGVLAEFVQYDKLNYLMLMMVDPNVHFHVVPRHGEPRDFAGRSHTDVSWPGPPDVTSALDLDESEFESLVGELRTMWPAS